MHRKKNKNNNANFQIGFHIMDLEQYKYIYATRIIDIYIYVMKTI